MDIWATEDFKQLDCGGMDEVICLKFPCYYLSHPKKVIWLLHQYRDVYDLWNTEYCGDISRMEEGRALKREITQMDTCAFRTASAVYTIANNVSKRLMQFNGIPSSALYHPPANPEKFYSNDTLPYVFFPSRLEHMKRQELLISAMKFVKSPVSAIIAGEGGTKDYLERLINELGLQKKVKLIGHIQDDEKFAWYANCFCVFFGPYDEDFGYVSLEAMLSSKPVITCTDSGGPLEFVVDKETGLIVDPHPQMVANAIDYLHLERDRAIAMGRAGLQKYKSMGITWERVISTLLKAN
jgi:glycosyltransferase involved in cell wall biosynthesis